MKLPLNTITNTYNFSSTSIPSLANRIIIVTGGTAGIGKQTILDLTRHNPQRLYLTARTRAKYEAAFKDIVGSNASAASCLAYLELDLSSLPSVQSAAKEFLAKESRLDILINNAGIMGNPASLTPDGYEIHFGTNYVGPAALTKLLMPLMLQTAQLPDIPPNSVRVVHVSSVAARNRLVPAGKLDWETLKTTRADINEFQRYAISKLAQIIYAQESSEQWPGVVHVSVHPGRVDTGLLDAFMADANTRWSLMAWVQRVFDGLAGKLTLEDGALTQLWAATWQGEGKGLVNGAFYMPVGVREELGGKGKDVELRRELWRWTEAELAKFGI